MLSVERDSRAESGVLHIVSGPSCVGKSTFVETVTGTPAGRWSAGAPLLFPNDAMPSHLKQDCVYHYNILRPIHFIAAGTPGMLARRFGRYDYRGRRKMRIRRDWSYERDPRWRSIAQIDVPKRALVLVASRAALLARAARRTEIESSRAGEQYPRREWLAVLREADLPWLYGAWTRELSRRAIPWELVDTTSRDYAVVPADRLEAIILGSTDRS